MLCHLKIMKSFIFMATELPFFWFCFTLERLEHSYSKSTLHLLQIPLIVFPKKKVIMCRVRHHTGPGKGKYCVFVSALGSEWRPFHQSSNF